MHTSVGHFLALWAASSEEQDRIPVEAEVAMRDPRFGLQTHYPGVPYCYTLTQGSISRADVRVGKCIVKGMPFMPGRRRGLVASIVHIAFDTYKGNS